MAGGWVRRRRGECFDPVGPESAEMVVGAGVDHGGLEVAQRHDVFAGFGVGGNIHFPVFDARFVEGAENGVALHACGFGVDGDLIHCFGLSAVLDSVIDFTAIRVCRQCVFAFIGYSVTFS